MTKFLRVSAFITFALLAVPFVARANVYDEMLNITRRQHLLLQEDARLTVEPEVAAFIAAAVPGLESATATEINDLLNGGVAACVRLNFDIVIDCPAAAGKVQMLAERETRIRALGRDLGISAWSFMEPLAGASASPFSSRAYGIVRMWMADDTEHDDRRAVRLRSADLPDDVERRPLAAALGEKLSGLIEAADDTKITDARKLTAAVWRYRFGGARWLRGLRPDLPPPMDDDAKGTDRELLRTTWPDIEDALLALYEQIEQSTTGIELQRGEAVMMHIPTSDFQGFPENVRYWAYIEELDDGTRTGDIGLLYVDAVESVLPTLCTGSDGTCIPALGGSYGPEGETTRAMGLCNYPLMRDGYLCADLSVHDADRCNEALDNGTVLASCVPDTETRETDLGGDRGIDGSWIRGGEDSDVCTPLRSTEYVNSIGNTMLFLNRCWMQSLEDHRLIPGRAPLGVGENTRPYDLCLRPDPRLGTILRGPQHLTWIPPPYRPEMLVQHIEETLCPGYPPGDPLCPFPLERRLDLPVTELLSLGSDLVDQPGEFEEESGIVRQFGEAVGARIGNRLYASYIRQRVATLTELLSAAAYDLGQFTKATFTDQLCPLNMTDPALMLDSDICSTP